MLLGDSGVGKTCLLVRFKDNAFLAGNFISTVGIDFRVSKMKQLLLYFKSMGVCFCCFLSLPKLLDQNIPKQKQENIATQ